MLHFRSHETPNASILHPASRTRDMHTPFQDNLRCMGEKFPRNFLETKNPYRANSVSHRFIIPHKSQKKLKQKNRSVRHISPTSETTEGTIYFTFLLPFLYPFSPLPSLTTTIYRISSLLQHSRRAVFRYYHTVTNAFIFQSTMHQDRPGGGT